MAVVTRPDAPPLAPETVTPAPAPAPHRRRWLRRLLWVAVAAVVVAALAWKVEALPVWAGILFALGFGLFIPQFFFSQPVRVAHGLLVALGCWGLAATLWRHSVARPFAYRHHEQSVRWNA